MQQAVKSRFKTTMAVLLTAVLLFSGMGSMTQAGATGGGTMQDAMEAVNNAEGAVGVFAVLNTLGLPGWDELSGTAQEEDVSYALLDWIDEYGAFTDAAEFEKVVKLGLAVGGANDKIYDKEPPAELVWLLGEFGIPDWDALDEQQQTATAHVLLLSGNSKSGLYSTVFRFLTVWEAALASVQSAAAQAPVVEDGAVNVPMQATGVPVPGQGEALRWASDNPRRAEADPVTGAVNPLRYGDVTISYVLYNTADKSIKNYGSKQIHISDPVAPEGTVYPPTEGYMEHFYIVFSEELEETVKDLTAPDDLFEKVEVIGTDGTPSDYPLAEGSVTWPRADIARITLPDLKLARGEKLKLTYAEAVRDFGGNRAVPTETAAASADTDGPVARVALPDTGVADHVYVHFSEAMSPETLAAVAGTELLASAELRAGSEVIPVTVSAEPGSVTWAVYGGEIPAAAVAIDPVTVPAGGVFKLQFTDRVKDYYRNAIQQGTVVPIGGAFDIENGPLHQVIRKAAGGRLPVIAHVMSSRSSLNAAEDEFYEDTKTAVSYEKEWIQQGFEPVFVPIHSDNYETASVDPEVIKAISGASAVFMAGGDQAKHARAFLTDEGADSPALAAIRNVFYGGGAIGGSSAGDHILSDIMLGGGDSYSDLKRNDMIRNSIAETWIGSKTDSESGLLQGFGFLPADVISDSHFDARGRLGRLLVSMRDSGKSWGIGVDENTGFSLSGNVGTVTGTGAVFVIDGTEAVYGPAGSETPFHAEGFTLHYLTEGDQFNLQTKSVITSKPAAAASSSVTPTSTDVFGEYETTGLLKSLADSTKSKAYGVSAESEPRFLLTFAKNAETRSYKSGGLYTITGVELAVGTGELPADPGPGTDPGTDPGTNPGTNPGGTTGSVPETKHNVTTTKDPVSGKTALTVDVNSDLLLKAIREAAASSTVKQAVVDSAAGAEAERIAWNVPSGVLTEAGKAGVYVVLKSAGADLFIPADSLGTLQNTPVSFVLETVDVPGVALRKPIAAYQLTVLTGGKELASFAKPIKIELKYKPSDSKEHSRIAALLKGGEGTLGVNSAGWTAVYSPAGEASWPVFLTKYGAAALMKYEGIFGDVADESWAAGDIMYLAAHGAAAGTGDGRFAPADPVTRAEFVTMLAKALNLVKPKQALAFGDAKPEAWYAEAVAAAVEANLVTGTGADQFAPQREITRQELAVLLTQALKHAGSNSKVSTTAAFNDAGDASGWAEEAIRQAAAAGLISGYPDGSFRPQAPAARAEAASLVKRLLDILNG
ncbi:S-layer homology domain-containing protein [Paenibacillus gansuensis]|uniref:S-layer homology domain-containing protein n=1 Tax=Paenibacillus gansuensis TaxID=306542 RepID=A0ABW5PIC7_9BACL